MIVFEVDKEYKIPENWEEIKLGRYEDFCKWQKANIPKSLNDYYLALQQKEGVTNEQRNKELENIIEKADLKAWFNFKLKAIQFFAVIPDDIIMNIKVSDVEALYIEYIQDYVLAYYYPPEIDEIQEFEFNDVKYKAPDNGEDVFGNLIPGRDMTARQFFESSEILSAGRKLEQGLVEGVAYMIAIVYSDITEEKKLRDTARAFKKLDMETVWGCSFFFGRLRAIYLTNILLEAAGGEHGKLKQVLKGLISTAGLEASIKSQKKGYLTYQEKTQ